MCDSSAVTEVPGESTLRKNFQQLQEGEGRRTPNPLYHAQPAFFAGDNAAKASPSRGGLQPVATPRGQAGGVQSRPQQQQQRQPGHPQVLCLSITLQSFSQPLFIRLAAWLNGKDVGLWLADFS